ncbi:hypothetical protein EV122DRAFT_211009 [Schizophyllum commune]
MEPLFRCPICFESLPMAEMCFTICGASMDRPTQSSCADTHSKGTPFVKDASRHISKTSRVRAQRAANAGVPEGSSTEGEDPDLTFRDGDQAGLERDSTGTISQSQTDERMSLLAKAQHAARMRHKLRGSHGLSAGLLSSMPTVLAATPLFPEPDLSSDDYSLGVRSTLGTADGPDGHAFGRAPRHCYCNGCVNTMQLRGQECPLCREYVRDVHPVPRFIEMDHSAYDNLKSRYDNLRSERYLLAVERNALKDASDALRAERDAQARHEARRFGHFRTNPASSSPAPPSVHNSGSVQSPNSSYGIPSSATWDVHEARALWQHRFGRPT